MRLGSTCITPTFVVTEPLKVVDGVASPSPTPKSMDTGAEISSSSLMAADSDTDFSLIEPRSIDTGTSLSSGIFNTLFSHSPLVIV